MMRCTHGPVRGVLFAGLLGAAGLWAALLGTPGHVHAAEAEYAAGGVIVKYKPGVRTATRAAMRSAVGAELVTPLELIDAELLRLGGGSVPEAVARLRLDPRVEYAEPDYVVRALRVPDDSRYAEQYALRNTGQTGGVAGADIGAEAAWDRFTGDPAIVVGIMDSGIDLTHPDLAENLWTNPSEIPGNGIDDDANGYVDDVHGYDFVNRRGSPADDNGHGTHCAGVIAARGDNGIGVAGVNWRLRIMALKFLNHEGSGLSSNAVLALQYAVRMGCRLTSNSWGGGSASQAMQDAVAASADAGLVFVAAAGNAGTDNDLFPVYPASYASDHILAVAATDHADQLAGFSNYGLTSVDIAAPGDQILSTWPGGGYQLLSGTSMATPYVAGALAFLLGRFPGMTAMQARAHLMRLSRALPGLLPRTVSGGRLDLRLASADADSIAPGRPEGLAAERVASNHLLLTWVATGDDSSFGQAAIVEVRYRIGAWEPDSFATATLAGEPHPPASGEVQRFDLRGLRADTPYSIALLARDEFGNPGPVSLPLVVRTLPPPHIRVTPGSFTAALATGDTVLREVELFNDSPGTYEWSAPPPLLDRVAGRVPTAWSEPRGAKGVDGPSNPTRAEGEGGPDAFGYRWIDSRSPGGPVYRWIDVAASAVQLPITGDEQMSERLDVGFAFPFYGRTFTRVRVSTNGYLSFGNNVSAFQNGGLPSISAPRALVAPLWDDLDFGAGTKRAYAQFDGSRFVVTWEAVPRFNDPGSSLTFQTILYPSGEIRFQYRSLVGQLESATIGIQDTLRTVGLTVAYDQPFLQDSLAVRIAPERQWLRVEPSSGELEPGARTRIALRFDAQGLGSGSYHGVAHLLGNDPDRPDVALDATLAVTGAPDVALSPRALGFGAVFTGGADTLQLVVTNIGADPLEIFSLDCDIPQFRAWMDREPLLPGESRPVAVEFRAEPGGFTGVLTLHTNDPNEPLAAVALTGVGAPAPSVVVDTDSVTAALTPELGSFADSTTAMVQVRNDGGSALHWRAAAFQGGAGTALAPVGNTALNERKGDPRSPTASMQVTTPAHRGGPDAAGYRWIDSDEEGGPAYEWVEISNIGTRVFGSVDDSTATDIALPFAFPFHGERRSHINICSNGWLSFTSHSRTFRDVALPDSGAGVPRDLIAVWWADLDLRAAVGAGRVYTYSDGRRFVVEWKDCVHYAFGGPYTFQVVLWPDGTIDLQYQTMTPRLDGATIGIQDGTGTVGLTVASDHAYVHDGLRIRIQQLDDWLVLDRQEGVLAPGGVDSLRVGLRARGRTPGTYGGEVRITTNDPLRPSLTVPAALHVGLNRASATATPARLGPLAETPSIELEFALPDAQAALVPGSLRLNGQPCGAEWRPEGPTTARLRVGGLELLDVVLPGDTLLRVSGRLVGAGWFEAIARFHRERPPLVVGPLPEHGSAAPPWRALALEPLSLYWAPPPSAPQASYQVSVSADDGAHWLQLGHSGGSGFTWTPQERMERVRLEVTALDSGRVVGTWLSSGFELWPPNAGVGPARALELAIHSAAVQPSRDGRLHLELLLPEPAQVRVELFDVRGGRLGVLAQGAFAAGVHPLEWRPATNSRPVAGVYFLRAKVGARVLQRRVVLLP